MQGVVTFTFIVGYLCIAFEHLLRINKTVSALITSIICWSFITMKALPVFEINLVLNRLEIASIDSLLFHYLGKISEILIFLIGAMAIVEIVDMHLGFDILKDKIKTNNKVKILWISSLLAFFLSSIIDNLTVTIIFITLFRKLIRNQKERLYYIGISIIAANAGGAWSPIGDVTTTMFWIAGKVTPEKLIRHVFIPSLISIIVPTFLASFMPIFKGNLSSSNTLKSSNKKSENSALMLYLGLSMILFIPIFKVVTNLPPYMGMMFSLSIVWIAAEYIKPLKNYDGIQVQKFSVLEALRKIELSSILFFLGILFAVGALESLGILFHFADWINKILPSRKFVVIILGGVSAIIDNVPLVAATLGMFSDPIDHIFWHFMSYATGTGGSLLIIGSAAGVAAMGMEKINFFWYLKNISWLALLSYLSGCLYFIW